MAWNPTGDVLQRHDIEIRELRMMYAELHAEVLLLRSIVKKQQTTLEEYAITLDLLDGGAYGC